MKLIVNLKLETLESQHNALLETLKEANKACDWISQKAFQAQIFKQFDLHKECYYTVKESFNLSAQMIVRSIAKVVDAYKIDRRVQRKFKPLGSIAYDDRIISFKVNNQVSIWTVEGRLNIPFVCGEHQQKLLQYRKGEVDLIYRKGNFYLNAVCEVPEESPLIPDDIIGVDFGIINIATTSDNQTFSGAKVEQVRQNYCYQRQLLQHKASKQSQNKKRPRSIHNLLKRVSGREKDFRKLTNHEISKKLVLNAKDTNRAIAIEDISNIKKGLKQRFRKQTRAKISGWSFYDLRTKLEYKSKLHGVPVIAVNPAYTSQICSKCGHCEKANRKNQAEFVCVQCNHTENADFNASKNIRSRAFLNTLQSSERDINGGAVITGLNLLPSSASDLVGEI